MKRQLIFSAFLLLAAASFAFAQLQPPNPDQTRRDVDARNRAVSDPANNPFNRGVSPTGRFLGYGKISGSETRKYVMAVQAETPVKVLSVGDGNTLLVDDGTNTKTLVRILGIDTPEAGQPEYEEAKRNLSDILSGKKVVLKYSLNNLKDGEGYFLARIFADGKDVGLNLLKNGFAWRNEKDKFFFEKKDDDENARAEAEAKAAKRGIWQDEKPQKPWEYKEKLKKAKEKDDKNKK